MTGGSYSLRVCDFREEDQDEVRALILDGLAEHWEQVDEDLNRDLDDIGKSHANGRTVVVRSAEGRLLGTGTLAKRDEATVEIIRMSVDSGCRRQGVGRQIVHELMATASTWGAKWVVLETSSAWEEVVAFYISCGFAITGRVAGEFGDDTWFSRPVRDGGSEFM